MISSDDLTQSWDALVEETRRGLDAGDSERLRQLDTVFHHHFFNQLRRGNTASRDELIEHLLDVTESPESRKIADPSEIQRLVCRWEHLEVLMEALRQDGDMIDDAERLIQSRTHAGDLLAQVAGVGGWGMRAGELARRLKISPQHLAVLLRELEPHDIITRHAVGRNVYVSLGLVGQLVTERRAKPNTTPALPSAKTPRIETPQGSQDVQFPESSPVFKPLAQPRKYLSPAA